MILNYGVQEISRYELQTVCFYRASIKIYVFLKIWFKIASAKRVYKDIDEIFGVVLESDGSDIDLGDNKELDSDWEYESEVEEQSEAPHHR